VVSFGKMLVWLGIVLAVLGVIFIYGERIPFVGKLPGDIHIQRKNFSFYFPIATCVLLSLLFTIVLYWLRKR